ncbi:Unknown protein [Striga hermonthica]|uniref:Integrase catalytic domain-containing protein n=1 Tax=Striga hermonthica TaxID=68872 RepID=A0A9N7NGM2_STRHE|nr:Unknown protein [Striga hermonthica]
MKVESLGGSRYFMTFIDDASRKLWVYFLRTKGEVFQYFKKFHAMVERQIGKPLKCLRSDNGREYTSHEFKNYCAEHGLRHEKIVPGTPQHNGVAERINRTIMEKVRYDMLIVGQDMKLIGDLKRELAKSFEMKDMGPAKQILGMQIMRDRKSKRLWLSQERVYCNDRSRKRNALVEEVSSAIGNEARKSVRFNFSVPLELICCDERTPVRPTMIGDVSGRSGGGWW